MKKGDWFEWDEFSLEAKLKLTRPWVVEYILEPDNFLGS
jgi:hypothetical protein